MASGIAQYSGQWLFEQLGKIQREVEQKRRDISELNGRLIAEDQRASAITDSTKRARVKAAIALAVKRQERLVATWRSIGKRFSDWSGQARTWLQANGYTAQLGAVPLVPVAIGVAALALLTAMAWITRAVVVNRLAADQIKQANDAFIAGRIDATAHKRMVDAALATANSAEPKGDPLGVSNILEALVPIGIIAALIVLGPPLLDAFASGRTSRRAA